MLGFPFEGGPNIALQQHQLDRHHTVPPMKAVYITAGFVTVAVAAWVAILIVNGARTRIGRNRKDNK